VAGGLVGLGALVTVVRVVSGGEGELELCGGVAEEGGLLLEVGGELELLGGRTEVVVSGGGTWVVGAWVLLVSGSDDVVVSGGCVELSESSSVGDGSAVELSWRLTRCRIEVVRAPSAFRTASIIVCS